MRAHSPEQRLVIEPNKADAPPKIISVKQEGIKGTEKASSIHTLFHR